MILRLAQSHTTQNPKRKRTMGITKPRHGIANAKTNSAAALRLEEGVAHGGNCRPPHTLPEQSPVLRRADSPRHMRYTMRHAQMSGTWQVEVVRFPSNDLLQAALIVQRP